jgi:hypothetical protein
MATTDKTLEALFSVQSMLNLYNKVQLQLQESLLMTPVYVRQQTAKRVMFSESYSEVSVLLRRGMSTGT